MAQNFWFTRGEPAVKMPWPMPTAAFLNVLRNRSSLSAATLPPRRRSVTSPRQSHRKATTTFPKRLASDLNGKDRAVLAAVGPERNRQTGVEPIARSSSPVE